VPAAERRETGSVPSTPEARGLLLRCLLFPIYPSLGRRNIDTISKVLMTLP